MNKALTILLLIGAVIAVPGVYAETTIEMKLGAGNADCVEKDTCYTPSISMIKRGEPITVINSDNLPHTLSSGTIQTGPNEIFNTGLMKSFSETTISGDLLEKDGSYDYFCIVHPWMVGTIEVVKDFYTAPISNPPVWFEQVIQWHNEGKIPDNEYYWAVGYLEDNQLIG